jgi:glycosyltransferase involved in cell wall biosynthesis
MCAGLPVVCTSVGGTAEVVIDGETGLLVPAGDDPAIASAILRLIGDPAMRQRMGAAGTQRARRLFSETTMVERYAGLYKEMGYG